MLRYYSRKMQEGQPLFCDFVVFSSLFPQNPVNTAAKQNRPCQYKGRFVVEARAFVFVILSLHKCQKNGEKCAVLPGEFSTLSTGFSTVQPRKIPAKPRSRRDSMQLVNGFAHFCGKPQKVYRTTFSNSIRAEKTRLCPIPSFSPGRTASTVKTGPSDSSQERCKFSFSRISDI